MNNALKLFCCPQAVLLSALQLACTSVATIGDDSRAAMAVFDFEPTNRQLDEPLRSQEMIMLQEVLYVEDAERATSPVAGLHRTAQQPELVPLPSVKPQHQQC